jgi:hypothetical protein
MPTLVIDNPDFILEEEVTKSELYLIIDALWLVPHRPDMRRLGSRLLQALTIREQETV